MLFDQGTSRPSLNSFGVQFPHQHRLFYGFFQHPFLVFDLVNQTGGRASSLQPTESTGKDFSPERSPGGQIGKRFGSGSEVVKRMTARSWSVDLRDHLTRLIKLFRFWTRIFRP